MSKRTKKRYTREFKESSVKLALESDQTVAQTAIDLGISRPTLAAWVSKYSSKKKVSSDAGSSVEEELRELRKENARLKQERDILKKAAAYFASEM